MKLSEYLSKERGRGAAIATAIGVSPQQVYQWANGSRKTPHHHGFAIETACGGQVTRQELFPNTWRQFWPDLDSPTKTVQKNHTEQEGSAAPPVTPKRLTRPRQKEAV